MRAYVVLATLIAGPALALVACGDDTPSSTPGAPEAGTIAIDGATQPPLDGSTPTPEPDASNASDASEAGDAGDGGPTLNALFAHIDQKLLSVDPGTGAVSEVGPTAQTTVTGAWDATAKVARVILGHYTPLGGATTPKLGTIDLCTGTVTPGPNITLGGNHVRRAESLVQDPATGTFWISVGTTGTAANTEFTTERVGTVDVATGIVTQVGTHQTYQDDGDSMTFIGSKLHLLDVATNINAGGLYELNPTNGAATKVSESGPDVRRIAWDSSRSLLFVTFGDNAEPNATKRSIQTMAPATGMLTKLGPDLDDATYPGLHFNAIFVAPKPVCP